MYAKWSVAQKGFGTWKNMTSKAKPLILEQN